MGRVAAVGVDDDLAAGEAGVAGRAADDEAAGRVHVVFRILVEQTGGEVRLDDGLDDRLAQILDGDGVRMLGGDDDGIDAGGQAVGTVFHGDLALAVRAEPGQLAALTRGGEGAGEVVGVGDGGRHELLRLRAGEAEHHALVASAGRAVVKGVVNAHGDIRGLVAHGDHHVAAVAVEAHLRPVVASVADGLSGQARDIDLRGRGDLAHDEDHAGRGRRLTRDAAHGVLRQHGVEHAVGDQVAKLVGMSLRDGLRGENFSVVHIPIPFRAQKKRPARGAERQMFFSLIFRFLRRIWHLASAGCRVSLGRSLHHS